MKEAAHAVIVRVLTLVAGHVTIRPNYRNRSRGVSITHDPCVCLAAWKKRGKVRNSDNAVHLALIISTMAGAEAGWNCWACRRMEMVTIGNRLSSW